MDFLDGVVETLADELKRLQRVAATLFDDLLKGFAPFRSWA